MLFTKDFCSHEFIHYVTHRHSKHKGSDASPSIDEKDDHDERDSDEDYIQDFESDQDIPGGVYFVTAL